MSVEHYENFPVASWLCPPALRPRSPRSTVRAHGRRHRRRGRRAGGERARGSRRLPSRAGAVAAGEPPAAALAGGVHPAGASDPRASPCRVPLLDDLLDAFCRTPATRSTPTAPTCSTTAAARPTRSAACCCTCTASTTPGAAAVGRDLQCAAADQLLAGPSVDLPRGRCYVPLADAPRTAWRRGVAPATTAGACARWCAICRLGRRVDARGRTAGARSPAAPAGNCAWSCKAACACSTKSPHGRRHAVARARR